MKTDNVSWIGDISNNNRKSVIHTRIMFNHRQFSMKKLMSEPNNHSIYLELCFLL